MVELLGCLGVEGSRCQAAGVGERGVQRTPVTRHGRSSDQAALFGSVHDAGQRGLLNPEALRQFSHSPGPEGQHADEPGLNRGEVMALGDPRMDGLHHAAELDQPVSRVEVITHPRAKTL